MKGVLSVLAISVLAAITKAYVIEFTEEAFNNLHLSDPQGTVGYATMVNSRNKGKFKLKRNRAINEIKFRADDSHLSNQVVSGSRRRRPTRCGNYHGINIRDINQLFCRISHIFIKVVGDSSQPQTMGFHIFFEEPSLILEVPILQIPSTIPGVLSDLQLSLWGIRKRVGLEPPFDSDNLLAVQNRSPLTMNFQWLEQLLSYSISKRVEQALIIRRSAHQRQEVPTYVTRPLLLSKDIINSCLNAIESINRHGYESSGSTSPTSNDSSDPEQSYEILLSDEESSAA